MMAPRKRCSMTEGNSAGATMPDAPLKKNITANFVGTIWQSLMGLIFVPLYIKFIGIESYGLIGIFTTLQVVFGLLDVGLGSTLTRELARLSALKEKEHEMRDLVRTLEVIYWMIAIAIGIGLVVISPLIAHEWVQPGKLSADIIEKLFLLIGIITVFQMPIGFYSGGLMGLQKQVQLNIYNAVFNTLRGAGAVMILWMISPTLQAFLIWQLCINIVTAVVYGLVLWRNLPRTDSKPVFQTELLKGIWKFSAGMSGISVLVVILTQLDKIILSKLLSLEMFGYYSLASLVAMSLGRLFTPVFFSIYPRFTQLASAHDTAGLRMIYHKSCQFIAMLVLPAAIILSLFSYEIILLWTQNPVTAENTYRIVTIMVCGTALNGLMNPSYALQLAHGWTSLSVIKNIIAVIILTPLIIVLTTHYGAVGAASAWLSLNIAYVLFEIPVMHAKLLTTEQWRWYWNDVAIPLAAGLPIALFGRLMLESSVSQSTIVIHLCIVSLVTLTVTIISLPTMRSVAFEVLAKIRPQQS